MCTFWLKPDVYIWVYAGYHAGGGRVLPADGVRLAPVLREDGWSSSGVVPVWQLVESEPCGL